MMQAKQCGGFAGMCLAGGAADLTSGCTTFGNAGMGGFACAFDMARCGHGAISGVCVAGDWLPSSSDSSSVSEVNDL